MRRRAKFCGDQSRLKTLLRYGDLSNLKMGPSAIWAF